MLTLRKLRQYAERSTVTVNRQGDSWIVGRYNSHYDSYIEQTMPYGTTEREALVHALRIDSEVE